jgi:hypothetical protein
MSPSRSENFAKLSVKTGRMRRDLSEMRRAAAGGEKLIAETKALIAIADALATASYYRPRGTIGVSTSAPAGPGHPLVKAGPGIQMATLPNRPIDARAAFEREVSSCFGVMPNFFCSAPAAPWAHRGTMDLRQVRLHRQPITNTLQGTAVRPSLALL